MAEKGIVSVEIDNDLLHASIFFTPDKSAPLCDEQSVNALLKKSGIQATKEKIEEFIKQTEQRKEQFSFPIAEGTPPEPPTDGLYTWADLPIPDELIPDSERIFKTALDPEVFIKKIINVKTQKKVPQKSRLHFKKEKFITVIEKRIQKSAVEVNPTVTATGWADKGMILLKKGPPSEGKEGISVTGTSLPPGEPVNEQIYCGKGVLTDKNKFIAEISGFVRRGENWIDIIPFKNHFWEVVLSKDKATPLLNLRTGDEFASPPTAASVIKRTEEMGFPKSEIINSEKIEKVINETINTGAYLENFPLTINKDTSFLIEATEDKLKGLLTIKKGSAGGKPLKLNAVGEAIKKSGFTGLNFKKIKKDLVAFYHDNKRILKDYVLATGKAPGKGELQILNFECPFLKEDEWKPILEELKKEEGKETAENNFPLSKIQKYAKVDKDTIVATFQPTKTGASGRDIFGNTIPGLPGDKPVVHIFDHLKIEKDSIISEIKGIILIGEDKDGAVFLKAVQDRQSSLTVELSDDAMEAYISVYGGKEAQITEETIRKTLKEKGVTKGIVEEVFSSLLEDISSGKDAEKVIIAAGKAPIHEGASRFKLLVDIKDGKNVSIGLDGSADYKNQDRITLVTTGTKLGELLSPDVIAKDGWDVTGKILKAEKAPPLELEIGENIVRKEDDKGTVTFYAKTGGELFFDGKKIAVKNVYTVKGDIGPKEGNIKFPGSVKVGGSVIPGFFIMAGGEVQIAGGVNGALISSGESIIIGQGVIGGGKAILRSKKDIDMAFAEYTVILAVGNIRIKNSCLKCKVKCNGILSLVSERGDLVGGLIKVTGGLDAHNVGNAKSVKTEVSFGQNYLIQDQIEKEEQDLEKLKEQITKLDLMMNRFEKEGNKLHLTKARNQKVLLMKSIEKKGVRLFTLREKFEEHFDSEIIVRGTLFPGVIFESHDRYFEVKHEMKSVRLSFNRETGHIENSPLTKKDS